MKYLLDTCVVSERMKADPDRNVLEWLSSVDEDSLYLSAVTIGEIRKGIALLGDTKRAAQLSELLNELEYEYSHRILSYNISVAETWGNTVANAERQGFQRPVLDSLIAATAKLDGLVLVTRNVADMEHMGVVILNPWDSDENGRWHRP